jgi:hypothetical protein
MTPNQNALHGARGEGRLLSANAKSHWHPERYKGMGYQRRQLML